MNFFKPNSISPEPKLRLVPPAQPSKSLIAPNSLWESWSDPYETPLLVSALGCFQVKGENLVLYRVYFKNPTLPSYLSETLALTEKRFLEIYYPSPEITPCAKTPKEKFSFKISSQWVPRSFTAARKLCARAISQLKPSWW